MTKEWKTVIAVFVLVGGLGVLLLFLFISEVDSSLTSAAQEQKRIRDSLAMEDNYQRYVDSLTQERNRQQLEEYLKKHPEDRPRKR